VLLPTRQAASKPGTSATAAAFRLKAHATAQKAYVGGVTGARLGAVRGAFKSNRAGANRVREKDHVKHQCVPHPSYPRHWIRVI